MRTLGGGRVLHIGTQVAGEVAEVDLLSACNCCFSHSFYIIRQHSSAILMEVKVALLSLYYLH